MQFNDLFNLIKEENEDTFKMYHGGKKWFFAPRELLASKKDRHNYGVGIYATNFLHTARMYAKGSRVVHELEIDKNYKELDTVSIDVDEAIDFIKNMSGLRKKDVIIEDLKRFSDRVQKKIIPIAILHNLIHNLDAAPGLLGKKVSDFLVSKGVDANFVSQSGNEFWLVIFNPRIIKSFKIVDPRKEGKEFPFEFPNIKNPVI